MDCNTPSRTLEYKVLTKLAIYCLWVDTLSYIACPQSFNQLALYIVLHCLPTK